MKKVLIIGSSGQLGMFLSDFLDTKFIVYRASYSISNSNSSRCYNVDVANKNSVKNIFLNIRPDIIINLAAITNVDYCENNKEHARSVNVLGLENIIKFSSKRSKIIHISSDYVFDGKCGGYSESDHPNPINYYGKTKLESENILRGSRREYLIVRASGVYSHFMNCKSNILTWLYGELTIGNKINAFNDQFTNPACVIGLSKFIYQSIILDICGIIHYGSLDVLSRYEFSRLFCSIFDLDKTNVCESSIKEYNFSAARPINSYLKLDRLKDFRTVDIFSVEYSLSKIKMYM